MAKTAGPGPEVLAERKRIRAGVESNCRYWQHTTDGTTCFACECVLAVVDDIDAAENTG